MQKVSAISNEILTCQSRSMASIIENGIEAYAIIIPHVHTISVTPPVFQVDRLQLKDAALLKIPP